MAGSSAEATRGNRTLAPPTPHMAEAAFTGIGIALGVGLLLTPTAGRETAWWVAMPLAIVGSYFFDAYDEQQRQLTAPKQKAAIVRKKLTGYAVKVVDMYNDGEGALEGKSVSRLLREARILLHGTADGTQQLLQGHCNPISCTCVSEDRRWIATADRGMDSMVVLWDSYAATAVKTISMPHPNGVRVMDLSPDARYLVTLSQDDSPQLISIWDLAAQTDGALYSAQVGSSRGEDAAEAQICVRFDPSDVCSIISNGPSVAIFWSWHEGQLSYYAPPLGERDFKQPVGSLTQSCFIPGTRRAVSATSDGDAVLWDCVELPEVASTDRRATKLIKLHSGALLSLQTVGELLVSGGQDGHVRFFDFDFRVVAWFEDLDAGPVSSVSFAHQPHTLKTPGEDGAAFSCPDFVVSTHNARTPPSNPARAARARCGAVHAPVPC